jgi:hypothetical protein
MSAFSTEPSRTFEYIAVVIEDVDVPNRLVHAIDRTGSLIQISFRDQPGGIFYVPVQGEKWIAVRKGPVWQLESQMEESDASLALKPGDMMIKGQSLSALGGNIAQDYTDHVLLDGGYAAAVLTYAPLSAASIQIYLNGLLLVPDLWAFDAPTKTVTFDLTFGEIGSLLVRYETAEEVA